jgi:hypothetical protein
MDDSADADLSVDPTSAARRGLVNNSIDALTHEFSVKATTTGTAVAIATGLDGLGVDLNEITLMMEGISLTGTDSFVIQLSTGGAYVNTGYESTAGYMVGAGSQNVISSTAGFVIPGTSAPNALNGIATLSRVTGTNRWCFGVNGRVTTTSPLFGGGSFDLGGPLDRIRISSTGTDTFDAGSISMRGRV